MKLRPFFSLDRFTYFYVKSPKKSHKNIPQIYTIISALIFVYLDWFLTTGVLLHFTVPPTHSYSYQITNPTLTLFSTLTTHYPNTTPPTGTLSLVIFGNCTSVKTTTTWGCVKLLVLSSQQSQLGEPFK